MLLISKDMYTHEKKSCSKILEYLLINSGSEKGRDF